jgi:hypothetical protein
MEAVNWRQQGGKFFLFCIRPMTVGDFFMRDIIHYLLHFGLPLLVAVLFYKNNILRVYLVMAGTMLIDADHLLATPIFDPCRCSIGFHPLHSYPAIAIYVIMLFSKRTRVLAIGLLIHVATDGVDCLLQPFTCK